MEPLFLLSVFGAGVLMCFAPCTLPLIPVYLAFLGGVTHEELVHPDTKRRARWLVLRNAFLFVGGFSLTFILFGSLFSFLGHALSGFRSVLAFLGGTLLVIFGLLMMGVFSHHTLLKERRLRFAFESETGREVRSFLTGATFALGWTPCVGPVLATVLFFAGSAQTFFQGLALLIVFCIGFSLPFLALAFVVAHAVRFVNAVSPYLRVVSVAGGVVLVVLGVALLWGDFSSVLGFLTHSLSGTEYADFVERFL